MLFAVIGVNRFPLHLSARYLRRVIINGAVKPVIIRIGGIKVREVPVGIFFDLTEVFIAFKHCKRRKIGKIGVKRQLSVRRICHGQSSVIKLKRRKPRGFPFNYFLVKRYLLLAAKRCFFQNIGCRRRRLRAVCMPARFRRKAFFICTARRGYYKKRYQHGCR